MLCKKQEGEITPKWWLFQAARPHFIVCVYDFAFVEWGERPLEGRERRWLGCGCAEPVEGWLTKTDCARRFQTSLPSAPAPRQQSWLAPDLLGRPGLPVGNGVWREPVRWVRTCTGTRPPAASGIL